jgi:hypothetical protein
MHGGCPLLTRTDYGTENVLIAATQCYFRAEDDGPLLGEDAHKYGTSTRNQRIENWWSHFRKSCAGWWINFFKDLVDNGTVDLENVTHRECLWFCFQGVLQDSLNKMKEYWNTHYIRPSRHETIPGVPDILYYLPESAQGRNCIVPVSNGKIVEMEMRHQEDEVEEENTHQDYFHYVMDVEAIQYPTSPDDALLLFSYLIEKAGVEH